MSQSPARAIVLALLMLLSVVSVTVAAGAAPQRPAGATDAPVPTGATSNPAESTSLSTSGTVETAVAHVAGYGSGDIPDARVVRNRSDLISQVVGATDANRSAIENGTAELAIEPPRVIEETDAGTVVELYSWTREQGLLLRWELTVDGGAVVHRRATAVRVGLGATAGMEAFTPPEGATVIEESLGTAARTLSAHGGGNVSVSDNIVTVYEDGDAESTTISLVKFGAGNEQVDVTVSIEGTRIGNRSGTPLTVRTDADGNGSVKFVPPATLYSGRACIRADSPSTTLQWCITDRTTGDDNNTMDDERGLLTIEEARNDTASGGGATITYVAKYTDQNLDSVIEGDANLSKTERDRQKIVDAALDAVTAANREQIGRLGFDEYLGEKFESDKRVPVKINDGTWDFHGERRTLAIPGGTKSGFSPKSITWNPSVGYGENVTRHARHIMAHEHLHLIQFSYRYYGTNNGGKWYVEGMARFIETLADPDVVHSDRSLFFASSGNGVNGYLRNPDRQSIGNLTYDYAIFWLYLYKRGGINAVERSLRELNNVSGSGDVDAWAPKALDRAIRRDANLRNQGIDSYREFLLEFHVAVYRATRGGNALPFITNADWSEYMREVDIEDFDEINAPERAEYTTDAVGTWGVDYVRYGESRAHDGLYFSLNRSDVYTRTIRIGPNSGRPNRFPDAVTVRGNLSETPTDPHLPHPNNTVYHGSTNEEIGVLIASLGGGRKAYNLTGRANVTVHRANNSLNERDERAIYLVPINQPKPGTIGTYGANGDLFVSVYPSTIPSRVRTGGPRNLTADLTLAKGSPSTAVARRLPTSERSAKHEFVVPIDGSESSVWKLTVEETSATPADPGNLFVHSNYLDGGPGDGVDADQLFGMPTDIDLQPEDLQAGSTATPNQISVVVNVDNGDNRYRHSPFPAPDPSHFLVRIGNTPIRPSRMSVAVLGEGKYRLTFTPPGGLFSAGTHRLCVAFTDTKFGVTEVTPSNCGEAVVFPINPPGDGSSIVFDPLVVRWFDATPVLQTTVSTANRNDTVSLVTVDGDGEGATTAIPTTRVRGERDSLTAAIGETVGALDPAAGETDLAAGLEASLRQLREADADAPRAAILVSPGRTSTDLEATVDAYVEAGIPVHVVAVGDAPNEALLRRVANRTGGSYWRASTAGELLTAISRIDRRNGRESVLAGETIRISGAGTVGGSFRVDGTADPLVVRLALRGGLVGNATVGLFTPGGEPVEPAARHGGIVVFRETDPEPGEWTYEVTSDVEGVEGSIASRVTSHSRVSLEVSTQRPSLGRPGETFAPGETVRIGASLVGPEGGLDDAELTGLLVLPDGGQRAISLESGGNGSYATNLTLTEALSDPVTGRYALLVTARRGDVVRRATLGWRVRPRPVRPELRVEDASAAPGETVRTDVVVDRLPDGLDEVTATVCASGDTGAGAIRGVESDLGAVTVLERGDRCLSFRVADADGRVQPGDENVTVATLTLSETVPGTAALELGPPEPAVTGDGGDPVGIGTASGTFVVEPVATETVQVVLEDTRNGLYRYDVGVSVAGDGPAGLGPIVDIEGNRRVAGWLGDYAIAAGGVGEQSVRLDAVDFENETRPDDGSLVLFELTYATDGGEVNLTDALGLEVYRLRNDNGTIDGNGPPGDPIDPERVTLRRPGEAPEEPGEPTGRTLRLVPADARVVAGGSVTYDLVVDPATDGVRAYSLNLTVANASVATIAGATDAIGGQLSSIDVTAGGERVRFRVAGGSGGTGTVTLATVTLDGRTPGTTELVLSDVLVGDRNDTRYAIDAIEGATVTVEPRPTAPDVTDDGQPARDHDGDGDYEDIDGDGNTNVIDVSKFLGRFDSEAVQQNPELFNFDGEGGVNILDVAELLGEI